jgi:Ca2+-binding EF-hand superfamily protein
MSISAANYYSTVHFAFDLYDTDGSGALEAVEIVKVLKDMYGNKYQYNPHALRYRNPSETAHSHKNTL